MFLLSIHFFTAIMGREQPVQAQKAIGGEHPRELAVHHRVNTERDTHLHPIKNQQLVFELWEDNASPRGNPYSLTPGWQHTGATDASSLFDGCV